MIEPGSTLGHFRVLQQIGSGGMGTIFCALDTLLHRKVALKIIHQHLLKKRGGVAAFQKEAATQAQLIHPNIVSLYAFVVLENHYVMVMEYVEGSSLRDILRDRGPLPLGEALLAMKQLLRGLRYAHGMQIIHRDIKPGNLIRTRAGQLKISDFGIAAVAGVLPEPGREGIMGTPWYASPEQISGQPVDHRSDLFSAGVTLYEMLTGEIPFDAHAWDPADTSRWLAGISAPQPPSARVARIPGVLDDFVLKSIRRRPEERFQDAGDMLSILDGIQLEVAGR